MFYMTVVTIKVWLGLNKDHIEGNVNNLSFYLFRPFNTIKQNGLIIMFEVLTILTEVLQF